LEIITERTIEENELAPLYFPENEHNFGSTHDLLPEYTIFNNIFRNTLTPKRGDRTNIRGSTRNLLLAIIDDQDPPCIAIFFWIEMWNMLTHGAQMLHTFRGSLTTRPIWSSGMMASMEHISLTLFGLMQFLLLHHPLLLLRVPLLQPKILLLSVHVLLLLVGMHLQLLLSPLELPLIGGKKQNILVKGLKTLISMCRSNDALIRESHQQMS
jgi:hypothetical protein